MKEEYLKVLNKYNISSFYHFTDISNLISIMNIGICNRKFLNENNIQFKYTDKNRFDNQMDCISLSINQVNKGMLHAKAKQYSNDWIIIEIDAIKLINDYFNKIYYCMNNASSNSVMRFLNNNKAVLTRLSSFEKMFDLNGNPYPQSELLVIGNIPCNYFSKIYVETLQQKMIVQELLNNTQHSSLPIVIRREMF